jgi:carboxyl-terminal processing protease
MMPASNRGVGMNLGFPDVCNTPTPAGPVPIPYPNLALNAQASPFSFIVKICMMAGLNMGSKIPMTSGDEAGSASPIKGGGAYTMGCPNVNIDGMPAITLLCPTTGNSMNNALGAVLVPSLVNVFFSYLPAGPAGPAGGADPYTRAMSVEALGTLGDAMSGAAEVEPVAGALLADGVGRVAIAIFTPDLPARLHTEIRRLEALGMSALVLDLRGNPGGDVEACLRVAEEFLPAGAILATALEDDGDEVVHRTREDGAYALPLAVLVDQRTASAAEICAGCLQAHGRAVVVGARTYGKGLAQHLVPAAGGVLMATAARYRLPGGAEIEGVGVSPDLVVSAPAEADGDAGLDAAWAAARAARA